MDLQYTLNLAAHLRDVRHLWSKSLRDLGNGFLNELVTCHFLQMRRDELALKELETFSGVVIDLPCLHHAMRQWGTSTSETFRQG